MLSFDEEILLLFFSAVSGICLVWACGPLYLHMRGHSRMTSEPDPDADLGPDANGPYYAEFYHQLRALGFAPLGGYRKTCCYFLYHWSKTFSGRFFLSADRRCYAQIYWLNPWDLPRLAFHSVLSDGMHLVTASSLADTVIVREGYHRVGHVTRDLSELLRKHRARELEFGRDGAQPTVFDGIDAVIAADAKAERGSLVWSQKIAAAGFAFNLILFGLGVIGFPWAVAWLAPDTDLGPFKLSLGLLCGGVLVMAHHLMHNVHIRTHRQNELAHAKQAVHDPRLMT